MQGSGPSEDVLFVEDDSCDSYENTYWCLLYLHFCWVCVFTDVTISLCHVVVPSIRWSRLLGGESRIPRILGRGHLSAHCEVWEYPVCERPNLVGISSATVFRHLYCSNFLLFFWLLDCLILCVESRITRVAAAQYEQIVAHTVMQHLRVEFFHFLQHWRSVSHHTVRRCVSLTCPAIPAHHVAQLHECTVRIVTGIDTRHRHSVFLWHIVLVLPQAVPMLHTRPVLQRLADHIIAFD